MKSQIYKSLIMVALFTGVAGCDKNFEEINTNPVLPTSLNPVYLFSGAQQASAIPTHHYEGEIVQQINTPYGGVLAGGNRNIVMEANSNAHYNTLYTGPVRNLTAVINETKDIPEKSNLYNMARIWRAYCFQLLTDTYGDIPYFGAGKGFIDNTYLPEYDDQAAVYEDLLKEYEQATDALDAGKDVVSGDLFYQGDVSKWKKLGNSLLLRAGMRYTNINADKAKATVAKAVDPSRGGVMESNEDNAYIQFNDVYNNPVSAPLRSTERHNYYIGAPFVSYLKDTDDPRLEYIAAKYENPANPLETAGAVNTNPEDQIGMPYGYDENSIEKVTDFPGKTGSAFKYSQFNRETILRLDAPEFLVTYSQTQLLLAEAAHRGYISGSAKDYYEAGIRGHMDQMELYGDDEIIDITPEQQDAFLAQDEIAFDPARALEQINEQYWVASFRIWAEAWANFRRSNYPELSPINFPGEDPSVVNSFITRLPYPLREVSVNSDQVNKAIARMGGNNLGGRIFWDKQ